MKLRKGKSFYRLKELDRGGKLFSATIDYKGELYALEILQRAKEIEFIPSSGMPKYAYFSDGKLCVFPTPDKGYKINILYYKIARL